MIYNTDDIRIVGAQEVIDPQSVIDQFPLTAQTSKLVVQLRKRACNIIAGTDMRLLVVVGPCSIHDPQSAIEYAQLLGEIAEKLKNDLCILMRVYFEKPRTTLGWKGLLNDPYLNGTYDINEGLLIARKLLADIGACNLGVGTEYLDPFTPQYIGDLVSWAAIGARTTESQTHRQFASGSSCPVGFKNTTDGNVRIAAQAVRSAMESHIFLSVTKSGHPAILKTAGNTDCHIVLRGGRETTNYDSASIRNACAILRDTEVNDRVMVDMSHANSGKDFRQQLKVCDSICTQISKGETNIMGVMIESHLVEGQQEIGEGTDLVYGQSITDPCLGWQDTVECLECLADAVRQRRTSFSA